MQPYRPGIGARAFAAGLRWKFDAPGQRQRFEALFEFLTSTMTVVDLNAPDDSSPWTPEAQNADRTRLISYLQAFDLSRPVEVLVAPAGTVLREFRAAGELTRPPGRFLTDLFRTPSELGLPAWQRIPRDWRLRRSTRALRGWAQDVHMVRDDSMDERIGRPEYRYFRGGGRQWFVPAPSGSWAAV